MDIYDGTRHCLMLKTLSYKIVGAIVTALVVFALTDKRAIAIGAGAISLIAKTILYYLYENLWAFINSRKLKQ